MSAIMSLSELYIETFYELLTCKVNEINFNATFTTLFPYGM